MSKWTEVLWRIWSTGRAIAEITRETEAFRIAQALLLTKISGEKMKLRVNVKVMQGILASKLKLSPDARIL